MDYVLERVQDIAQSVDELIPRDIPVPDFITKGADALGQFSTSPSFPYRLRYISLADVTFWQAAIVILLQPLIWNCIGRLEHYTRILTKVFRKPVIGVYALALWIFVAGLYRDALFVAAMDNQQTLEQMGTLQMRITGAACLLVGGILVFLAFYRLGITGTYLGDYFGILMDEKVTAFPFNVLSDPMYDGSTLAFLGKAILAKSPTGVLLSAWIYLVYRLACIFEGAFTEHIYAQRETEIQNKKTS